MEMDGVGPEAGGDRYLVRHGEHPGEVTKAGVHRCAQKESLLPQQVRPAQVSNSEPSMGNRLVKTDRNNHKASSHLASRQAH